MSDTRLHARAAGVAVLFSAGLDSAVLLAQAIAEEAGPSSTPHGVQPIYVSAGLAWEPEERAAADRLLAGPPYSERAMPLVTLHLDMRDTYPPNHWAVRGEAPGYDTPDEDVYIEGRNIVLLSKAAVYMARAKIARILLGPLAGNPFPDATPDFFSTMGLALRMGLAAPFEIEAPFSSLHKRDVVRLGRSLGVPLGDTLSCMQPRAGLHCGRCSKCRERVVAFREAGGNDPTMYAGDGQPRS